MIDWQRENGKRCGCKGSDDMCGCQNNAPITEPHIMPDEIIAWPSNVTASGQIAITGGWSANQHFNDEAVRYVREDLNGEIRGARRPIASAPTAAPPPKPKR